jgi:hypothetical protein
MNYIIAVIISVVFVNGDETNIKGTYIDKYATLKQCEQARPGAVKSLETEILEKNPTVVGVETESSCQEVSPR